MAEINDLAGVDVDSSANKSSSADELKVLDSNDSVICSAKPKKKLKQKVQEITDLVAKSLQLKPLLNREEIHEQYLKIPAIAKDFPAHGNEVKWLEYEQLANLGRAHRSVWKQFISGVLHHPDRRAMVWCDEAANILHDWTYQQFLDRIKVAAANLHNFIEPANKQKLLPGDRIVLCFPPGLDFFVAFWACISLGLVAVPVCPPDPFQANSDSHTKLYSIISNCEAKLLLTNYDYLTALQAGKAFIDNSTAKSSNNSSAKAIKLFDLSFIAMEDLADYVPASADLTTFEFPTSNSAIHPDSGVNLTFLQYTSGSSGQSRGVMVGSLNLFANAMKCTESTRVSANYFNFTHTIGVSWLPTFHDMGLIGFHCAPLLFGGSMVYFSPLDYLKSPLLWLKLLSNWSNPGQIQQNQGNYCRVITGAPPFALELTVKRLKQLNSAEITQYLGENFSLTNILSLIVGAEPLRLASFTVFSRAMERFGFNPRCFMPAYGLAENVLFVSSKRENSYPPAAIYVDKQQLLANSRIVQIEANEKNCQAYEGQWLVSSGEMHCSADKDYWSGTESQLVNKVLIVHPADNRQLAENGSVGEIWLFGHCSTGGYWNNSKATAATFMGHLASVVVPERDSELLTLNFIRTGDLGAIYKNELYVVGRIKELIILNGVNYYPHDIEQTVLSNCAKLKAGAVAAVAQNHDDKEYLTIVAEITEGNLAQNRSSGDTSGNQQRRGSVELANKLFNWTRILPQFLRAPIMRTAAKYAAKYIRYSKAKQAAQIPKSPTIYGYSAAELASIVANIRRSVFQHYSVPIAEILLFPQRCLPKTSSGKLRRAVIAQSLQLHRLSSKASERIAQNEPNHNLEFLAALLFRSADEKLIGPRNSHNLYELSSINRASKSDSTKGSHNFLANPMIAAPLKVSSMAATAANCAENGSEPWRLPLEFDYVRGKIISILSEEMKLEKEMIESLSTDFGLNQDASDGPEQALSGLEQFGLDSVVAMRISGRFVAEFDLLVPLSPFLFLSEPTLEGMCKVVQRLYLQKPIQPRRNSAKSINPTSSNINSGQSKGINSSSSTGDNFIPCILGVGVAVPGPGAPQSAILNRMISDMQLDNPERERLFYKIGQSAGVDRRYSVLPSMEGIYFGRTGLGNNEPVQTRNNIYKREAPKLACKAAQQAIEQWGQSIDSITHVIAVTCTGIIVPGLEFQLLSMLGLPLTTQRLSIQFMGCFGFVSGIKAARAFAAENRKNRILLVCCELCSLHMQLDDRMDNIIGAALFGDGAGAVIVGNIDLNNAERSERVLFEINNTCSVIIPNTSHSMSWELTNSGMAIGLGRDIPISIYESIETFMQQALRDTAAQELDYTDQNLFQWAIHPGGPMIIQAILDRLNLPSSAAKSTWKVLREYGNMSSATLVFVLQDLLQGNQGQNNVYYVPMLAFGPGLNVEGSLLTMHCNEQVDNSSN
jgi:predicted naringenin-chalcone synthase/acyl-CoA synthetase (AMP-forming)/AMP-acid ligase II